MEPLSPTRRRLIAATAAGLLVAKMPRLAVAQEAGPAGEDDDSLPSMLARAYDPVSDGGTGPTTLFAYAHIARQLEVRGLRHLDPTLEDRDRVREWSDGIDGLYVDDRIQQFALSDGLWASVGFDPSQIDQTLVTSDPPRQTRIYRGRFDSRVIDRALTVSGYEPIETDHGPVLSIGAEGEFSLTHPVQGIVLSAYNNVAVVEDAYIVAGAYLADVEATLGVFSDNGTPLASNQAVDALLTAVDEELVSATVLDGSILSTANMPDLSVLGAATPVSTATPVPTATIAPASYALFGITPGSMPSRSTDKDNQLQGDNDDTGPRSAFVVALHLGSTEEAEAAVPVIEGRLAEGVSLVSSLPYADLLGPATVAAVAGSPLVKIRLTGDRVGRIWLQALFGRDLVFVYTE